MFEPVEPVLTRTTVISFNAAFVYIVNRPCVLKSSRIKYIPQKCPQK